MFSILIQVRKKSTAPTSVWFMSPFYADAEKDDRRMMDNLMEKLRSGEMEYQQRRQRRQHQRIKLLQQSTDEQLLPYAPTSTDTRQNDVDKKRRREQEDDDDRFSIEISAMDLLKSLQEE